MDIVKVLLQTSVWSLSLYTHSTINADFKLYWIVRNFEKMLISYFKKERNFINPVPKWFETALSNCNNFLFENRTYFRKTRTSFSNIFSLGDFWYSNSKTNFNYTIFWNSASKKFKQCTPISIYPNHFYNDFHSYFFKKKSEIEGVASKIPTYTYIEFEIMHFFDICYTYLW